MAKEGAPPEPIQPEAADDKRPPEEPKNPPLASIDAPAEIPDPEVLAAQKAIDALLAGDPPEKSSAEISATSESAPVPESLPPAVVPVETPPDPSASTSAPEAAPVVVPGPRVQTRRVTAPPPAAPATTPATPAAPSVNPRPSSGGGAATPARTPTPPPTRPTAAPVAPAEVARPEVPVPEALERERVNRGLGFFYQFMTGEKKGQEDAKKQLESLGLYKEKDGAIDESTKALLGRAANVEDAKLALLALQAESQKKENRESDVKKAHFESEMRKAQLELEHRLDEMKLAWLGRWETDNRERNPSLSKAELKNEAISYTAQVVFRAATNFYPELERERSALVAQTPQEQSLLQRYGAWSAKAPTWKRVMVSAAIAGGTTVGLMSMFSTVGVPIIAGIAGWRSLRAAGATAAAGAITGGIEKLFGRTLDERGKKKRERALAPILAEKRAHTDRKVSEFEQALRTELAGKENWIADRETALAVMQKVDAEAKTYSEERATLFGAQERATEVVGTKWRKRLAIGTGLAVGGGMALSAVDWDKVPEWFGAAKKSVYAFWSSPVTSGSGGGGASVLEAARATVRGWIPTGIPTTPELPDPLPICDAAEKNVLTIGQGSSVWSTGMKFIGETVQGAEGPTKVTKEIFNEAWKNSTVDMVTESGKHIKVPISDVDLVHAKDQLSLTNEGGKWLFRVGDYAKDAFNVGNGAKYAEILHDNGYDVPRWLERSPLPPATLVESHADLVTHVRDTLCIPSGPEAMPLVTDEMLPTAEASADSIPSIYTLPEELINPQETTELAESFAGSTLYEQERAIATLNEQIYRIEDVMATPGYDNNTLNHLSRYHGELLDMQQQFISSSDYMRNAQDFNDVLLTNDVAPALYMKVEDMSVRDFLKISKDPVTGSPSKVASVLRDYRDSSTNLRGLLQELSPGKRELRMSVGQFMKSHVHELAINKAV